MGAKPSRTPPVPTSPATYHVLDRTNNPAEGPPKRILLLGGSDSGKSTIMKQMQLIYKVGIGDSYSYRELVCQNAYAAIATIIEYMRENGIPWSEANNNWNLADELLNNYAIRDSIPASWAEVIHRMWNDAATKWIMAERRFELQFPDNGKYFLDNIIRIGRLDYRPSVQDILMTWSISTGMFTTSLTMNSIPVEVIETSGARPERRKWINGFESASVVIFCAPLSEYDQHLREQFDTNRMQESLCLFDSLVNSRWFLNTSFILFLTKADIFYHKITQVPLKTYCPDYKGGPVFENGVQYIRNRYLSLSKPEHGKQNTSLQQRGRVMKSYVLNATDINQVTDAFAQIQASALANNLARSDFV